MVRSWRRRGCKEPDRSGFVFLEDGQGSRGEVGDEGLVESEEAGADAEATISVESV